MIQRFEDILAWQAARRFCRDLVPLFRRCDSQREYPLKDQLDKSSGSIMDNIAEGFDRENNKEFLYFLRVAKASGSESRSQLYRAFDRGLITEQEFNTLMSAIGETTGKIGGLIRYLKSSHLRGAKFAPNKTVNTPDFTNEPEQ